jgi:hypothetical protein
MEALLKQAARKPWSMPNLQRLRGDVTCETTSPRELEGMASIVAKPSRVYFPVKD